mmetsp:Transcript_9433/g.12268  ORF Transcript_9433/g.12268 Transcript_9433/m.12268 type:complete len:300 (+) Transcript_9433:87-986(+)
MSWPYFRYLSEGTKILIFDYVGSFIVSDREDLPKYLPWACFDVIISSGREFDFVAKECKWICRMLGDKQRRITSVDVSGRCTLYPDFSKDLAESLKINNSLLGLTFRGNCIFENDAQMLAEALERNSCLSSLTLNNERCLQDKGVQHLSDTLRTNQTLTKLDMRACNITDAGMKLFAEALTVNDGLKTLNLGFNHIRDDGARYLASSLRSNKTLLELGLEYNLIGENGALLLVESLTSRETHICLNLAHNPIGLSAHRVLDSLAVSNSTNLNNNIDLTYGYTSDGGYDHFLVKDRLMLY